jgi:transposase
VPPSSAGTWATSGGRSATTESFTHVLCDNAGTHTAEHSKAVRAYMKVWGHGVVVHYLPKYAPETNPAERVR